MKSSKNAATAATAETIPVKKYDVFFDGVIKCVSPVSFSQPYSTKKGCLPTIGGKLYIPASSLRGKLRRHARDVMYQVLGCQAMPLADFHFLTQGGIKGAKPGEADNEAGEGSQPGVDKLAVAKVLNVRAHNPLVSLFGAMAPQTIAGRLMVSHAIEKNGVQADTVKHVRADDMRRTPDVADMICNLDEYDVVKADANARSDLMKKKKLLEKSLGGAEGEARASIREEIKLVDAEIKNGSGKVQIGLAQLEYQAIPQGASLSSSFMLLGATEQEIVLFVKAIDRMARSPVVCGKLNHGLGVIAGEWDVRMRQVNGDMQPAGTVSFAGDFMPVAVTGKAGEWLAAEIDTSNLDLSAALAE